MKPCPQVCKPVKKTVSYGSFTISYTQNQCGPDPKCVAANRACQAKLMGLMQAAVAAEAALKRAVAARASAKTNRAKADAAVRAAGKEAAAAEAALKAAKSIFDAATSRAAASAKDANSKARLSAEKDKEVAQSLRSYEKVKGKHLKAQAVFNGAKSAAAKALADFNKAVAKHCEAEQRHAQILQQIGHPNRPKRTCTGKASSLTRKSLPCKMKPCRPICVAKQEKTCFGSFCIPYTTNVCKPDLKCKAANTACSGQLMGLLKAAHSAEVTLKKHAALKNSAKATHAQRAAAAAAAKKEVEAAKKAMAAAQQALRTDEQEAASAKADKISSAKVAAKDKKTMEAKQASYTKAKTQHLAAQAAYAGARSSAAKALATYRKAIKTHCDSESRHAAIVKQLHHDHMAKSTCKATMVKRG